MGHAILKLSPGVDVNDTPALNEAGVASCNLIRYTYAPVEGALVQKLGGWTRFFPNTMAAIVRALVAWQDLNEVPHLAFGTQNIGSTGHAQLGVITNGSLRDITPQTTLSVQTPQISVTAGSSTVTVTDPVVTNLTSFDSVYIQAQLAIGGIVLYGVYPIIKDTTTTYQITAIDILGAPEAATSTSTTAVTAEFDTANGSNAVLVTLADHGYAAGSTFPVLISTVVGGITFFGNYIVQSVQSANTFTILGSNTAIATTSGFMNGGDAAYLYSLDPGAGSLATGYGVGGYGDGPYGGSSESGGAVGTPIAATDWTLDYWGEILLACPINGSLFQSIFAWDPLSGDAVATAIPQAPPVNDGFLVAMPQRQVVAWGSTATGIQDPLLINWCDVNNFNSWIATVVNQAGSYRIPRGSKIVGAIQGPTQIIVWTDIDIWAMQYIGTPNIYGFNEIGTGCGLIARKAGISYNGVVYWMGPSQFYMLAAPTATTAGGVVPLQCPVWDAIFQNLDQSNLQKIRIAANSRFNEITWYYPTLTSGGEVAAYVKYNTQLGVWDYGALARSAWTDQSVLGPPIGADPNSLYLYQHETSPDADGQAMASYFRTGFAAIGDGESMTFVDQVWPDMKFGTFGGMANATLNLTFYGANYPNGPVTVNGPFAYTQSLTYLTLRVRNRLISLQIGSDDVGSFWRIGAMRYRFAPDGRF